MGKKTKIILKEKSGNEIDLVYKRSTPVLSTRNPQDKRPLLMDIEFHSLHKAHEFLQNIFYGHVDNSFTVHHLGSGKRVELNNIYPELLVDGRNIVRVRAQTLKTTDVDLETRPISINFLSQPVYVDLDKSIVEVDSSKITEITKITESKGLQSPHLMKRPFKFTVMIPYDMMDNLFNRTVYLVEIINHKSMIMDVMHDVIVNYNPVPDGVMVDVWATAVRRVHFNKIENL